MASRPLRPLGLLEGIGRLGVFVVPLFYRVGIAGPWKWGCVGAMALSLALYYAGWARYFASGRRRAVLYRPLLGIPIPLAVSPVVYFAAASTLLDSIPLAVAALFGGPHIYLSHLEAGRTVRAIPIPESEVREDGV